MAEEKKQKSVSDAFRAATPGKTREQMYQEEEERKQAALRAAEGQAAKEKESMAAEAKAKEEAEHQARMEKSQSPEASEKRKSEQERSDALAVLVEKQRALRKKGYAVSSPEFQAIVAEKNKLMGM